MNFSYVLLIFLIVNCINAGYIGKKGKYGRYNMNSITNDDQTLTDGETEPPQKPKKQQIIIQINTENKAIGKQVSENP